MERTIRASRLRRSGVYPVSEIIDHSLVINESFFPIFRIFFIAQSKVLDLVVYDHDFAGKDDFMGRASIDLASFEPERTHNVEQVNDRSAIPALILNHRFLLIHLHRFDFKGTGGWRWHNSASADHF